MMEPQLEKLLTKNTTNYI